MKLAELNSATKYPSIPTYHAMGERGRLTMPCVEFKPDEKIYITEKIDGTNGRIILPSQGNFGPRYFIGSREEMLTAAGDYVANPSLGIVEALRPIAERLCNALSGEHWNVGHDCSLIRVLYFEVYGGKTTASAKNYTCTQTLGARLFDVCTLSEDVLCKDVREIAAWRDNGGQEFRPVSRLLDFAENFKIETVPYVGQNFEWHITRGLEETAAWLRSVSQGTLAAIDAYGPQEGLVIRNEDRSVIAKLRHEDYDRTLGRRKG